MDRSITRPPATADMARVETIVEAIVARLPSPDTLVYCPMAIGRHVDHVLTRACGLRLAERGIAVIFYADFFYRAFAKADGVPPGGPDIRLTAQEFTRKLIAVAQYSSQVRALFGGRLRLVRHFVRHGRRECFVPHAAFTAQD